MPAPQIDEGGYLDWVVPYLTKQNEDALKLAGVAGSNEKLTKIQEVMTLFELTPPKDCQEPPKFCILETVEEVEVQS